MLFTINISDVRREHQQYTSYKLVLEITDKAEAYKVFRRYFRKLDDDGFVLKIGTVRDAETEEEVAASVTIRGHLTEVGRRLQQAVNEAQSFVKLVSQGAS